jgi:hypothetical protein
MAKDARDGYADGRLKVMAWRMNMGGIDRSEICRMLDRPMPTVDNWVSEVDSIVRAVLDAIANGRDLRTLGKGGPQ